eukprot:COSAG01_NODE_2206_length_8170_cov_70.537108_5_plen_126_part_00
MNSTNKQKASSLRALLYYYENRDRILERNNTQEAKQKRKSYYYNYYQKNKETINEKRRMKKGMTSLRLPRRRTCKVEPAQNQKQTNGEAKKNPFMLVLWVFWTKTPEFYRGTVSTLFLLLQTTCT